MQLKTVQISILKDKTNREATNFGVEVMDRKAQLKGELGNVRVQFTFAVSRKRDSKSSLIILICKVQNYVEIVVGNLENI